MVFDIWQAATKSLWQAATPIKSDTDTWREPEDIQD